MILKMITSGNASVYKERVDENETVALTTATYTNLISYLVNFDNQALTAGGKCTSVEIVNADGTVNEPGVIITLVIAPSTNGRPADAEDSDKAPTVNRSSLTGGEEAELVAILALLSI